MNISKLITIASILAGLAVASGHLPQILWQVKLAQLELLKGSQTSSWGKLYLLPVKNS